MACVGKRRNFSSSVLLSSLELSDTQVYEPLIRALLGTASHFCEVVVLKLRTAGGETGADGDDVGRALPLLPVAAYMCVYIYA